MFDPKQIVTPHAFQVDPDLLGTPLATPKRRLAAVLIDLIIGGIFSWLGAVVFLVGVGILCLKLAYDRAQRNEAGKIQKDFKNATRFVLGIFSAVVLFVIAFGMIDDSPSNIETISAGTLPFNKQNFNSEQWNEFIQEAAEINYSDSAEAAKEWKEIVEEMTQSIITGVDVEVNAEKELPENAVPLLTSYAAAIQAKDSAAIDSLQPVVAKIVAGHKIAALEKQNELYLKKIATLKSNNEQLRIEAENPSIINILKAAFDDLGLAVGWIGLYFILALIWGKGQTPGKWLLSLKVIRLNGEELTYWKGLERFGGYAAGLATGLLGFLQVYWDPNRQGIQDKIAETAVVDLRKKTRKKYAHLKEAMDNVPNKE